LHCLIFHGSFMYLNAQNEDSNDEDYEMADKCVLSHRSGQFYFSSAKSAFVSRRLQWHPSIAQ
jgi:hypothetical protein